MKLKEEYKKAWFRYMYLKLGISLLPINFMIIFVIYEE